MTKTQGEQLDNIFKSLDTLTSEFIQSLPDAELRRLKSYLESKTLIASKIKKERIRCKTHFKPE